jgi:hypothetical protein
MTRPATPDRDGFELRVIARMKPGVTLATAKQDVDGIARQLVERYPVEAKGWESRSSRRSDGSPVIRCGARSMS